MATTILFATSSSASLDGDDSFATSSDGDNNSLRNVKHRVTGWQRRSLRNVKYHGVNKQSSVTGWQRRFVSSQRQSDGDDNSLRNVKHLVTGWQRRSFRNVKYRGVNKQSSVTGWQRRFVSSQRQAPRHWMATTILFATSSTAASTNNRASLDGNDDLFLRNVKRWRRQFSSQRQTPRHWMATTILSQRQVLQRQQTIERHWMATTIRFFATSKRWRRQFSSQRQAPRHWMATTILFATSSTAASTNNRASLDGNDDSFLRNVKAMAMTILFATSNTASLDGNDDPFATSSTAASTNNRASLDGNDDSFLRDVKAMATTILFATSSTASLDGNDDSLRNVKYRGVNKQSSVTGWQRRFVSLQRQSDGDDNSLRNVKHRVTGLQRRSSSQRQELRRQHTIERHWMATTICFFATLSFLSLQRCEPRHWMAATIHFETLSTTSVRATKIPFAPLSGTASASDGTTIPLALSTVSLDGSDDLILIVTGWQQKIVFVKPCERVLIATNCGKETKKAER
ncbi:hypothetical protein MHU86_16533 [Fragilaria crotonensis]|nr:hypothetical protein MHU86_16533 [Fragilaria crotonensis]